MSFSAKVEGFYSLRRECSLRGALYRVSNSVSRVACSALDLTINSFVGRIDSLERSCAPICRAVLSVFPVRKLYAALATPLIWRISLFQAMRFPFFLGALACCLIYRANKVRITPHEVELLKKLDLIRDRLGRSQTLSKVESAFLTSTLKSAITNQQLMQRLIATEMGADAPYNKVFYFLQGISQWTQQLKQMMDLKAFNDKLRVIKQFLSTPQGQLTDQQKLSSRELGTLSGLASLSCTVLLFAAKGSEELSTLKVTLGLSREIIELSGVNPNNIADGSIVIQDSLRLSTYDVNRSEWRVKIFPYGHTSLKCRSIAGASLFHLVWDGGVICTPLKRNSRYLLTSRVYRLDFSKLLTEIGKAVIPKKFGKDYFQILQNEYERILYQEQKNDFSEIELSTERQVLSLFCKKRAKPGIVTKINSKKGSMICSEFIAKITVIAVFKLNLRLKEICGMSDQQEELLVSPINPCFELSKFAPKDFTALPALRESFAHLGRLPMLMRN